MALRWILLKPVFTTKLTSVFPFLAGTKSPGLMVLEHELSDQTVQAFMNNFPKVKSNGWKTASLARIIGGSEPYQNVHGDTVALASVYLVNGTSTQVSTQTSATMSSALSTTHFLTRIINVANVLQMTLQP